MSSLRSPSSSIQPPPVPTAPRPRLSAATSSDVCPSHAQFLLEQTRTSLSHLHKSGALDALTYREVDSKLSRAVLKEERDKSADKGAEEDEEEVKLGKRNAMVRKAMVETDLLPSMVEAALNVVGGPFLGGSQIDAIVELVSLSQERIAETVTDPRKQRAASSNAFAGLKGVHTGVSRGVAAANSSLAELNRRREENRLKAEKKKVEKRERKIMKEELKRERAEIQKRRAAQAAEAAVAPGQAGAAQAGSSSVLSRATTEDTVSDESSSSSEEDEGVATPKSTKASASGTMASVLGPTVQEGPATADVACTRLGSASSAAITTFVPWPGIMISSTIVASPIEVEDASEKAPAGPLAPPPRRTPPASAMSGSSGLSIKATREDSSGSSMKMVTSPSSISASSLQFNGPGGLAGSSRAPSTSTSGAHQDGSSSSSEASSGLRPVPQPDEAQLLARQPPPLPPHPSRVASAASHSSVPYDAGGNAPLSGSRTPTKNSPPAYSAGDERPSARREDPAGRPPPGPTFERHAEPPRPLPPSSPSTSAAPSTQVPRNGADEELMDVTDKKRKGLKNKFHW